MPIAPTYLIQRPLPNVRLRSAFIAKAVALDGFISYSSWAAIVILTLVLGGCGSTPEKTSGSDDLSSNSSADAGASNSSGIDPETDPASDTEGQDVTTEHWGLKLPSNWRIVNSRGNFRAESWDGVYAVYIRLYKGKNTIANWAKDSIEATKNVLFGQEDYQFEMIQEAAIDNTSAPYLVLDGFDQTNHYRIFSQHKLVDNTVYAISFHDYWCESYDVSKKASEKILSQFVIKE